MFPYELDLSWVISLQRLGDWLVLPMSLLVCWVSGYRQARRFSLRN